MDDVYLKVTKHGKDTVVAVCDAELLGKTLEGGRVPFKVSEGFYKGLPAGVDEALDAIRKSTICNMVGKRIVGAALINRMVKESAIVYFGDIPHTQIVVL